jgi:hypothetical protein
VIGGRACGSPRISTRQGRPLSTAVRKAGSVVIGRPAVLVLVRRRGRAGELAFYRCYSPEVVPLRELVRVVGRRWAVEESFQTAKGLSVFQPGHELR